MRWLACASLIALAFALAAPAHAQYPAKTIRLIVPVGAGAATDIVARFIGPPLATALGRQVVIDNRPGVGGNIGGELAANSPPDGYTVMMAFQSQAVAMTLYSKPGYDLVRDFAPVTLLATGSFLVAAHPTMPVKSVKELVAFAKARPGQVNVGLAGSGLILAAHLFYGMGGVKMTDVIEAGLPGYEASSFYGLLVPTRTPTEIISRLHAESVKVLGQPELKAQFGITDLEPAGSTPEQFGALIRSEIEKWGKIVEAAGLRPE